MNESLGPNDMSNQSNCSESHADYLKRAAEACEAGDLVLGMHLYLAAYEKAVTDPSIPDGMALSGLREAWELACNLKERSMAEYVFEKLEPFLTGEEIAHCANELQNLALDRLEQYGFSREELQDMAEMISQDFIGGDSPVIKVESISIPTAAYHGQAEEAWEEPADEALDDAEELDPVEDDATAPEDEGRFEPTTAAKKHEESRELGMGVAPAGGFNPYDMLSTSSIGTSYHAATNEGAGSYVFTRDKDRAAEAERARAEEQAAASASRESTEAANESEAAEEAQAPAVPVPDAAVQGLQQASPSSLKTSEQSIPSMPKAAEVEPHTLNFHTLAGYDEAVSLMRDFGVGMQRDQGFRNFITMMNARHGLDRMPALDTLLFRAPVIEDAMRFVDAVIGEIGLPVLRMSMEEGVQGMPVLCVTAQGNSRPRMNQAHNRFEGPAILVIEDLDTWTIPQVPEATEGIAGFVMANISRGARDAMDMIRASVENPDVYVLATATVHGEVEPFFYELLEPITIIDIGMPNSQERDAIWREIMNDHPSTRALDRAELVEYSAGLARYDIYLAARSALEEAYKTGLVERMYLPVSRQNMLDKLAACQPLDSDEYRAIEDAAIRAFRDELDDLENLLGGSAD